MAEWEAGGRKERKGRSEGGKKLSRWWGTCIDVIEGDLSKFRKKIHFFQFWGGIFGLTQSRHLADPDAGSGRRGVRTPDQDAGARTPRIRTP